jgi:guanylate kinase
MKTNTEQINQILENANKEIKEIERASYFSYRIINDDINSGYDDLRGAIFSIFPFLKPNHDELLKLNNKN